MIYYRHVAGKSVRGARTTELSAPDVRTIREAAQAQDKAKAKGKKKAMAK